MIRAIIAACWVAFALNAHAVEDRVIISVNGEPITQQSLTDMLAKTTSVEDALEKRIAQVLLKQHAVGTLNADAAISDKDVMQALRDNYSSQYAPSRKDIEVYILEHPELFADRKLYQVQQIVVLSTHPRLDEVKRRFTTISTFQDLSDWLTEQSIPFTPIATQKLAEDWPMDFLLLLNQYSDGDAGLVTYGNNTAFFQLVSATPQPISERNSETKVRRYLKQRYANNKIKALIKQLSNDAKIVIHSDVKEGS